MSDYIIIKLINIYKKVIEGVCSVMIYYMGTRGYPSHAGNHVGMLGKGGY